MAQPGDVLHAPDRGDSAIRCATHAAGRPVPGRPLLRHAGGRVSDALDALLLDLRTPRGLRADSADICFRLRNRSRLFTEADVRIPGHGRRHSGYRLLEHERVGASYVHCWD